MIISIGSPLDIAAKLNTLQRRARVPLLIGSDLEAGTALRLVGGTAFPSNMGIGATGREQDAYAVGRITALEGRAVGIHLAFAPVADINSNPANPIINTRSFGADPRAVSRLVSAEVRGLQDNGMLATVKHFPGHGDVEIDSHLALPVLDKPWTRLDTVELVPFRGAISAGVSAVMSAHISLPVLETGTPTPATLVPAILTGVLRDSLGFKGVIVTDALNMGGIVSGYGAGEAGVLAFLAGADILLQPADPAVLIDAMSDALGQGRFNQARLDRSVRRVLQMKEQAGLFRQRTVPLDKVMATVGSEAFRDTARAIAARSIVLISDRGGALDSVRRKRGSRSVIIYGDELNPTAGNTLVTELRMRGDSITTFRLSPVQRASELRLGAGGDCEGAGRHLRRCGSGVRGARHHRHARLARPTGGQCCAEHADGIRVPRVSLCRGAGAQPGDLPARLGVESQYRMGRRRSPDGCRHLRQDAGARSARNSTRSGPQSSRHGARPVGRPYALTCRPVAHRLHAVAAPKKLRRREFRGASGGDR